MGLLEVRIIDPNMCLGCRFGSMATVVNAQGQETRMISCKRGDCDNWDTTCMAPVESVVEDPSN